MDSYVCLCVCMCMYVCVRRRPFCVHDRKCMYVCIYACMTTHRVAVTVTYIHYNASAIPFDFLFCISKTLTYISVSHQIVYDRMAVLKRVDFNIFVSLLR